jgi:hypothetical protein
MHRIHVTLDRTCKYVVVAVTFAVSVIFTPPDASNVVVPVVVSLSVATALCGKMLKRLLRQKRPAGARKTDGGMPSSHAVSLGYLSTAGVTGLLLLPSRPPAPGAMCASAAMVLAACYYSWLRVHLGHHTIAQCVVGYAFGSISAAGVMAAVFAGDSSGRPGGRIDGWPLWVRQCVLTTSVVACTVCMLKVGRRWLLEDFQK